MENDKINIKFLNKYLKLSSEVFKVKISFYYNINVNRNFLTSSF